MIGQSGDCFALQSKGLEFHFLEHALIPAFGIEREMDPWSSLDSQCSPLGELQATDKPCVTEKEIAPRNDT